MRIFILVIFLAVYTAPAWAGKTFNAQSHTLDNGLQIVVVENHRAPVVTHMIWYRAGAADEPRGKSGIAHFLEHLMFKGHSHPVLGSAGPGEFSKTVRSLGERITLLRHRITRPITSPSPVNISKKS